ncbi:amphi-Trp domain-containing protein [Halobiforma nitratireducens]|uniref:Amphi-Trp domain-containing protein n=1 Tax=Halobiforma nitratireducens JCM 10879 TaxID=1227454 RepID=M0M768_9EURY|nr:amphi-Trp domain-containing protein [Halobiforma nitratireducens]EMA41657.1 hypothetical protein C446_05060 [Halobiforma nitratireducens JCM 10879]
MADRTSAEETLTRDELAAYFDHLGTEFADDADAHERGVQVQVGNKTVQLDPPDAIDLSVDVVERSPMFRGPRETIQIEVTWKTARSEGQ